MKFNSEDEFLKFMATALQELNQRVEVLEVKFGIRPTKREQNARQTPDAH